MKYYSDYRKAHLREKRVQTIFTILACSFSMLSLVLAIFFAYLYGI